MILKMKTLEILLAEMLSSEKLKWLIKMKFFNVILLIIKMLGRLTLTWSPEDEANLKP